MNPSLRIAAKNYAAVFGFVVLFGVLATLNGDAPNLVALKLLFVPFWWLSLGGLKAIYRQPIVEARWTARSVEHTVVEALLVSAFTTIMTWNPETSLSKTLEFFGTMSVLAVPGWLFFLHVRIRELRKAGG